MCKDHGNVPRTKEKTDGTKVDSFDLKLIFNHYLYFNSPLSGTVFRCSSKLLVARICVVSSQLDVFALCLQGHKVMFEMEDAEKARKKGLEHH